MLCARASTSVQNNGRGARRGQRLASEDLKDTGCVSSSVVGCLPPLWPAPGLHLSPTASPCIAGVKQVSTNACSSAREFFFSLAWAKLEKKKLYLRQKGSMLTGRLSPCATSLCRETFGYVSPYSSLEWGQSGCFSTLRRNTFKTDVNVIYTQTTMALRWDCEGDTSFSLSSQAFL